MPFQPKYFVKTGNCNEEKIKSHPDPGFTFSQELWFGHKPSCSRYMGCLVGLLASTFI